MNQLVLSRKVMPALMQAIAGLEQQVEAQAITNLGDGLSVLNGAQRSAAITAEELAVLANEIDYAHTRLRSQLLARLEVGDLWAYHPGDYGSLNELVQDLGISKSEASDLLAWERHIYPYLEEKLGLQPFQVWQLLSKSKRRRLTPLLRDLTQPGYETDSDKVRATLAMFRQHIRDEQGITDDEDQEVVSLIINRASMLSSRDLEHEISPEPTPSIEATAARYTYSVIDADTGEIVSQETLYRVQFTATEDQMTMLRRRFPDRLDLQIGDGPDVIRERQE